MTVQVFPKREGRGCYFCGAVPRTKEHILPDWLGKALPVNNSYLIKHEYDASGVPTFQSKTFTRPILRQTVKETCAPCNNGWMSQLETRVKPILGRLVVGHPAVFDAASLHDLRRWAAKTHIMRAQLDRDGFPMPPDVRAAVMEDSKDLAGWVVWLGSGSLNGVRHRNWSMTSSPGRGDSPIFLSQTALSLGRFMMATAYVSHPGLRQDFVSFFQTIIDYGNLPVVRLSSSDPFFVWPPSGSLKDAQNLILADAMRRWVNLRLGGEAPKLPDGVVGEGG